MIRLPAYEKTLVEDFIADYLDVEIVGQYTINSFRKLAEEMYECGFDDGYLDGSK